MLSLYLLRHAPKADSLACLCCGSSITAALKPALEEGGYPLTPEGCKQFLRDWAKTMNPLYLMASTPAGFCYGEDDFATSQKGWLACCAPSQQFLLEQPGAKVDIEILGPRPKRTKIGPPPPTDGTWEPQGDDLITMILMPLAEELNLPIAMKFGAMRGVNPSLRTGQVSLFLCRPPSFPPSLFLFHAALYF